MNSKERVQAAISHQPVDRVPLGFYAVDYDIVEKVLGRKTFVRNKIETALALWAGRRDEVADSFKKDTVEFYKKIDCADIILPKEASLLPPKDYEPDPPKKVGEDKWQDRHGRVFAASRLTNELMCIHDPDYEKEYRVADFEKEIVVEEPDASIWEAFDYVAEKFGQDKYIAAVAEFSPMMLLGGTVNGLMRYALEPELIHAACRQSAAKQNKTDKYWIRKNVSGVCIEQDMAGTNGPLISPTMFNSMVFPYMKQRVQNIKQYSPQIIFHCCGNTIPIMDMFIESGIDCYQSMQTTAGMEIGRLKELYGHKLCFWGGVAVEQLIMGTPQDVRQEVRRAIERGAPGGGFILGPSHSIAKNTKYENFMAMLDEYCRLA